MRAEGHLTRTLRSARIRVPPSPQAGGHSANGQSAGGQSRIQPSVLSTNDCRGGVI
jgi:hypothetical protein